MKYLKQFGIILLIAFAGEVLHALLPLPIPAGIYGIILLFLCLCTKLLPVSAIKEIRLDQVKDAGEFLIEIMPVMFIPAAVGLMDSWEVVRRALIPYVVITVVTTFIVMAVAGRVVQRITKLRERKEGTEA